VVLRRETVVKLLWARHLTIVFCSQPGHSNGHRRRTSTVPSSEARMALRVGRLDSARLGTCRQRIFTGMILGLSGSDGMPDR
jgi:hypothetical protein